MGKSACRRHSVRMDTLDNMVIDLSRQLFTTERLTEILAAAFARRGEKTIEIDGRASPPYSAR